MGCSPLIFVGMDLAFTDMKAYAKGVVADASVEEQKILQGGDFDPTPGVVNRY